MQTSDTSNSQKNSLLSGDNSTQADTDKPLNDNNTNLGTSTPSFSLRKTLKSILLYCQVQLGIKTPYFRTIPFDLIPVEPNIQDRADSSMIFKPARPKSDIRAKNISKNEPLDTPITAQQLETSTQPSADNDSFIDNNEGQVSSDNQSETVQETLSENTDITNDSVNDNKVDGQRFGGLRDKYYSAKRFLSFLWRKPVANTSADKNFRDILTTGLDDTRRNILTVAIFSFWVNFLVLAIPIYLFQLSDRVLSSRSIDTLVMLTMVVVGAIAVHVILDMVRRHMLMRIAVDVEVKLGAPVLSAAAKAAQNGSSREFQTLADLQHLRSFITGPVLLTMMDAPVAPVYLLAVFLIHPHLGFIVLVASIILLTIALFNQKLTAAPFARANAYGARANVQADAMARNAQVINAMGMIPEGVQMWGKETAESLKSQVIAQDKNIMLAGISKFARLCTQISILGWGAYLSLSGGLTGGMVIAASIIGSRALAPVEGTIEGWRGYIQAKSAYARVRNLLQTSQLNIERLRLPRPKGHLSVERVLFVPPPNKKVILNGVSFELQPGEALGIVGNSGSGKSTLAKMLVGSFTPTAGNIRLDKMDLRNWDPRQFGESVGYLPQDIQLFPSTIKANIARMQADATDEAVFNAAEMADIHEMIAGFAQGYETMIGMDGSPLSGGQKQRLGLARAFYGDPRLVVLDEPNSNLDTIGENALAKSIEKSKKKGITIVAITQRPALLKSVDKILILKDGTVQGLGPRDEILPVLQGKKQIQQQQAQPQAKQQAQQAASIA